MPRPMLMLMLMIAGAATLAANRAPEAPLEFSYIYPAPAKAIPALNDWFVAERARLRSAAAAQANAAQRDAAKGGMPFNSYKSDRTWKVVTDTPRFLSLSLESCDYTGGAHGNSAFGSLVWDKEAQARRPTKSFFASLAALRAALSSAFCRQLDAERREKRGGTLESSLPEFSTCIDPTGETVILGSADRRHFTRIGILIPPYEAGPYSDGDYEVTLPVTRAVMAAVKPEFRAYFAVAGTP